MIEAVGVIESVLSNKFQTLDIFAKQMSENAYHCASPHLNTVVAIKSSRSSNAKESAAVKSDKLHSAKAIAVSQGTPRINPAQPRTAPGFSNCRGLGTLI